MRSSSLKQGIVQGALAQRGIAVVVAESWVDREIVQRTAAQIGWVRNLAILQYFMAVAAIENYCKELGI